MKKVVPRIIHENKGLRISPNEVLPAKYFRQLGKAMRAEQKSVCAIEKAAETIKIVFVKSATLPQNSEKIVSAIFTPGITNNGAVVRARNFIRDDGSIEQIESIIKQCNVFIAKIASFSEARLAGSRHKITPRLSEKVEALNAFVKKIREGK